MALLNAYGLINTWEDAVGAATLTVTIVGIADGPQPIKLRNEATGTVLFDGNATFSSNSASVAIDVPDGTVITGRWLGSNPPTTGSGLYGVAPNTIVELGSFAENLLVNLTPVLSGNTIDILYQSLRAEGYTGALQDMEYKKLNS